MTMTRRQRDKEKEGGERKRGKDEKQRNKIEGRVKKRRRVYTCNNKQPQNTNTKHQQRSNN